MIERHQNHSWRIHAMRYAAGTREEPRRITVKAEHAARDSNSRYPITNLTAKPTYLYQRLYCARGDMENRIKEQQLTAAITFDPPPGSTQTRISPTRIQYPG